MKHFAWALTCTLAVATAPAQGAEITISCGAVGQEREFCERAASAWSQKSGHTVRIDTPPELTNERYFKYLIELGDGDDRIDVYQIDVIWPGLLARYMVDLANYVPAEEVAGHFQTIIENNTVDGRLVGMPWYTDVGLLYYRTDLLEKQGLAVPQDWSDLADMAAHIQEAERGEGRKDFWGFVFQGAAYEGLTCNALEWVSAAGGGTILDEEGSITVNNPKAVLALGRAANWIGTVSPRRVTSFNEEDARAMFQLGNAAFMRNWPYAWSLLSAPDSPVAGKVDVMPLPRGGPVGQSAATLGGWQLAVSKFSKNPEVAADLVRYLTSPEVQKDRAVNGSYAPTIESLYEDPEVLANPLFAKLKPVLETAVARPSHVAGENYMAVTARFWEAVHNTLTGDGSAADNLAALEDQLRLISVRTRRVRENAD